MVPKDTYILKSSSVSQRCLNGTKALCQAWYRLPGWL